MPISSTIIRASLLLPLLAVGTFSLVNVFSQQGDGDALAALQQQAHAISPALVDHAVRTAPDPFGHEQASSARCTALGGGELRNPWRCELSYPTGHRFQYQVTVATNGSYVGQATELLAPVRRPFSGTISGCCVAVP